MRIHYQRDFFPKCDIYGQFTLYNLELILEYVLEKL